MAGGLVWLRVEVHLRGGVGRDDWWQEVKLCLALKWVLIRIEGHRLLLPGEVHNWVRGLRTWKKSKGAPVYLPYQRPNTHRTPNRSSGSARLRGNRILD